MNKRGRKVRFNNDNNEVIKIHNKYSLDNLITKLKYKLTNIILHFINRKIDDYYGKNNIEQYHLKKLNSYRICSMNSRLNKKLLQTTIGDYLSIDISYKYKCTTPYHNKNLIVRLINEDKEKKNFYIIFNKTFLECLEHFRGTKNINGLEGLENEYSNMIEEFEKKEEDEEYILQFINVIYTFENILYKKKETKIKFNTNL